MTEAKLAALFLTTVRVTSAVGRGNADPAVSADLTRRAVSVADALGNLHALLSNAKLTHRAVVAVVAEAILDTATDEIAPEPRVTVSVSDTIGGRPAASTDTDLPFSTRFVIATFS